MANTPKPVRKGAKAAVTVNKAIKKDVKYAEPGSKKNIKTISKALNRSGKPVMDYDDGSVTRKGTQSAYYGRLNKKANKTTKKGK